MLINKAFCEQFNAERLILADIFANSEKKQ